MGDFYRNDMREIDLDKPLLRTHAGVVLATGDNNANRFGATLNRAGVPIDLTGDAVSVLGYFIRSDGETVVCEGEKDGDTVYVDLPAACYTQDGSFSLAIKVSSTEITQTVRVIDGYIGLTQTEELVDPGEVIPSLDDLFAQIAAMETATQEAEQAAEDAQTAITEATANAQTAIAAAEMAAAQAVNGNAPPIVQAANGTYVEADDAAQSRAFPLLSVFGRSTQDGTPSPESPAEIASVGDSGSITARVYGKNLFPGGVPTQVTCTNSSGEQQTKWGYAISLPAGTYTLWAVKKETATANRYIHGVINDEEGNYLGTATIVSGSKHDTRTITLDVGDIIYLYNGSGNTLAAAEAAFADYDVYAVSGGEIVEGDLATTGGSVTVATPNGLHSIPVSNGGNYTDASGQMWLADEIDLARGVIVQRVGKVVMDGVTAGMMAASKSSNANINTYNVSTADWGRALGANLVLVTSHYTYLGTGNSSSIVKQDGVALNNSTTSVGSMYVGHNSIATLADYNAWLAAQLAAGTPVTVLYPLAEAVETALEGEALANAARLCSLYPVTTITAENAWIEAQYVADTKTYIDNKFAELAAQLIDA